MDTLAKTVITPAALLALCIFGGCAADPTVSEQNFGNSVRNMVRVQTYDPSTLDNPSEEAVEGADGQKLEGALEAYRESASTPQSATQEVSISVGGQ
jgi:hypothetical protein